MAQRLDGKVAIVTGAGGGIGGATVRAFVAAGARVLAVDRDGSLLGPWAACEPIRCWEADLRDGTAAAGMVEAALQQWGHVDVLCNVAGGSGRRHGDGPVDQCSEAGWDWVMATNLKSVFLACRAVLPGMVAGGGGAIVNVASVLGMVGGGQVFATHAYAASKAGIIGLTRAMASYYAPQHVRVNALCPGLIDTPMASRALEDPPTLAHVRRMQPLVAGPGSPEQVASAALFLATDAASLITGTVLPVDGGWTAQ